MAAQETPTRADSDAMRLWPSVVFVVLSLGLAGSLTVGAWAWALACAGLAALAVCVLRAATRPQARRVWCLYAAAFALLAVLAAGSANSVAALASAPALLITGGVSGALALVATLIRLAEKAAAPLLRRVWLDGCAAGLALAAVAALASRSLASRIGSGSVAFELASLVLIATLLLATAAGLLFASIGAGRLRGLALLATSVGLGAGADAELVRSGRVSSAGLLCVELLYGCAIGALASQGSLTTSAPPRVDAEGSAVLAPLLTGLTALVVLGAGSLQRADALASLFAVGAMVVVLLRSALSAQASVRSLRRARIQALTDDLTGLRNRRSLVIDLGAEIAAASPILLVIYDLNGFKGFNDTFGHPAGTRCSTGLVGGSPRRRVRRGRPTGSAATSSACSRRCLATVAAR